MTYILEKHTTSTLRILHKEREIGTICEVAWRTPDNGFWTPSPSDGCTIGAYSDSELSEISEEEAALIIFEAEANR